MEISEMQVLYLDHIIWLVKTTANDSELGEQVRLYISKLLEQKTNNKTLLKG